MAQILGYRDTKKAIKQHVSEENKIIQLIHANRWGGGEVKRPLNKMTLRVAFHDLNKMTLGVAFHDLNKMIPEENIVHLPMSPASMNLCLVLN